MKRPLKTKYWLFQPERAQFGARRSLGQHRLGAGIQYRLDCIAGQGQEEVWLEGDDPIQDFCASDDLSGNLQFRFIWNDSG